MRPPLEVKAAQGWRILALCWRTLPLHSVTATLHRGFPLIRDPGRLRTTPSVSPYAGAPSTVTIPSLPTLPPTPLPAAVARGIRRHNTVGLKPPDPFVRHPLFSVFNMSPASSSKARVRLSFEVSDSLPPGGGGVFESSANRSPGPGVVKERNRANNSAGIN